ncbi:MAG: calcium/sodium antiporter [Alphaproteobacteria bacterium]
MIQERKRMIDILMILGGLVLLFFGGEGLIKGAVSLARNFGLSKLLVSAVVVGFGTSMPEMTVSVGAALKGASDIAIGNVVGSNIANILLIVGIAAIMCSIFIAGAAVKRDTFVMLGASLALCGLAMTGMISFAAGLVMFAALIAYIAWSYMQDKKAGEETVAHIEEDIEGEPQLSRVKASAFALGGLVLLIGGAYILVEGAVSIARGFGISEAVIGLTIVAVGTSLPELATAVVAAMRKHSDVIIGNIVGSNIFNILAILGVTAMISPIPIGQQIATYDVWIMLGVAAFLSIYLLRGLTIGRISGLAMLGAYIIYTAWLYMNGMSA